MSPIPLLTSAYLAPVHYYTKLISAPFVVEEHSDHYVKQTFRNRCVIATADGTQSLTIPVQGCKELGGDHKTPTREMRIIDHNRWRQLHWNALVAAYERTPFFEYYADDFAAIYQGEYERLVDFNADLHHLVLRGCKKRVPQRKPRCNFGMNSQSILHLSVKEANKTPPFLLVLQYFPRGIIRIIGKPFVPNWIFVVIPPSILIAIIRYFLSVMDFFPI